MALEQPPRNKMVTAAPKEKAGFHFSGDGVWHNMYIWAENIEEATNEWLNTRQRLNPLPSPASTPALEEKANEQ